MKVYLVLGLALFGCTKPNPAVCCLDAADCKEVGLDEVRDCSAGLACVEHQCEIPSCSMTGCMAAMPVCNITTDVCEGCTDSSHCSKFADTDVCDAATGACVECVSGSDCDAAKPVCDANVCRGCKLDSECASGACGDDGACVDESAIVYMDPAGTDSGTCSRAAPCQRFGYSITQASNARKHIVMNAGTYVDADVQVRSIDTSAASLFIHGGGAAYTKTPFNDGALIAFTMPATIRNLEFSCTSGGCISLGGSSAIVVENVRIHGGYTAISTGGNVTLRDIGIDGVEYGIDVLSGQLTVDRAVVQAATTGIIARNATVVGISNTLVYGTSDLALDLNLANASIVSSTIADSGANSGTGPRAVRCGTGGSIRSSIIWAPGLAARVPVEGCNLVSTIAGPTPVPGAMNVNPQFVDAANHDYHLAASSPARDAVDSGPATDFEGDARPQGARFDIGADEAK